MTVVETLAEEQVALVAVAAPDPHVIVADLPHVVVSSSVQHPLIVGSSGPQGIPGVSSLPYIANVPAVSSYTVVHGRGYIPASVSFYDESGKESVVGVSIIDDNSIDILQDNPSSGTVSIA